MKKPTRKDSLFVYRAIPIVVIALFLAMNLQPIAAQTGTPKQILQAQLAASGAPVGPSGETAATPAQFKAAVLKAIESNPDKADGILIEALKMIRDKFVASYVNSEGRFNRDALIDLFKSAVEKYGPQSRPASEARGILEDMLRQANEIFPELIGDFREAIDPFLTEDQRSALDNVILEVVGSGGGTGSIGYFTFSNPGASGSSQQFEPENTGGGSNGTGGGRGRPRGGVGDTGAGEATEPGITPSTPPVV